MPNTHRGWAAIPLYVGSGFEFDSIASKIAAGSALGGAYDLNPSGLVASTTFPRAASLHQAIGASAGAPLYDWDTVVFRSTATAITWTTDPVGTANASVGLVMFGTDPKPMVFPGDVANFTVYGVGAGVLNLVFFQGDDLDI